MEICLYPLVFSNMVMRIKSYCIICDYERIYEGISTILKQEIIMKLQTQVSLDTKPDFIREIMVSQAVYKAWRRQLENGVKIISQQILARQPSDQPSALQLPELGQSVTDQQSWFVWD